MLVLLVLIDKNGNSIGHAFPEYLLESSLRYIFIHYIIGVDKKLVYNMFIKKIPKYKLFKNENYIPLSYQYYQIDFDHKLKLVNEPWVVVKYQPEGSTKNIFKQYLKNPQGFKFARANFIRNCSNLKENLKNLIHFFSSALFTKYYRFMCSLNIPFVTYFSCTFKNNFVL